MFVIVSFMPLLELAKLFSHTADARLACVHRCACCLPVITGIPAMLREVLFLAAFVSLSVCLHTITKTTIRNCCNLVGICHTVNTRSDWKFVTFDLDL